MKKLKAKEAIFTENVGIGEGNPTNGLLHLKQSSNDAIRLQRSGAGANDGNIYFGHSGGGLGVSTSGAIGVTNPDFFISSSGNVGIGTASPGVKLDVSNGDIMISDQTHGATRKIYFDQKNSGGASTDFSISSTNGSIDFRSEAQGKSYLYLQAGGNVGIGTTNPTSFTGFMGGNAIATTINANDGAVLNLQRGTDINNSGIGALQFVNTNNSADAGMGSGSQLLGLISIANVTSNGNTGSDAGGNLRLYTKQEAGSCLERMRITSDGNVGIGTTNPSQGKLVTTGYGGHSNTRSFVAIAHNNNVESYFRIARMGSGDSTSISLANNYNRDVPAYQADDNTAGISDMTFRDDGSLSFSTGAVGTTEPVEKMRIETSGNVGIGTTNPDVLLHVGDGTGTKSIKIKSGGGSSGDLIFESNVNEGIIKYEHTTDSMRFHTNASEKMRIDSSGRVLVGTNTVHSGTNGTLYVETDAVSTRNLMVLNNSDTGSTSAGVVAIYRNQNFTGGISNTNTSTSFNTTSDYRLKKNVEYDFDAITRLKQLKPARFNFIVDADKTVDGFLAHEVQEIVPEAITGEKDAVDEDGKPDYQGIDQSKLVPLLTKAIQEQQTMIEDLKKEIKQLKS